MFIEDSKFNCEDCYRVNKDIRILSVGKMNLKEDSVVLDIGCEVGSISIQCALLCKCGKVLGIENDEKAFEICKSNIDNFQCENVKIVKKDENQVLDSLIHERVKFNSIFINGNKDDIESIILKANTLLDKKGTMVINSVTLDNTYRSIDTINKLGYKSDISLVNINKIIHSNLIITASNPVYIIQCIK